MGLFKCMSLLIWRVIVPFSRPELKTVVYRKTAGFTADKAYWKDWLSAERRWADEEVRAFRNFQATGSP